MYFKKSSLCVYFIGPLWLVWLFQTPQPARIQPRFGLICRLTWRLPDLCSYWEVSGFHIYFTNKLQSILMSICLLQDPLFCVVFPNIVCRYSGRGRSGQLCGVRLCTSNPGHTPGSSQRARQVPTAHPNLLQKCPLYLLSVLERHVLKGNAHLHI